MLKFLFKPSLFYLLTLGILLPSINTNAQVYREEFGKNRIQYKYFNWQFLESNNFEVYYYDGGKDLASKTIEYLESDFSRITEAMGYFPYSKTRIFLYNSIVDKQQSNVGIRGLDFTIGGQTNFIKAQVEVAFSGDFTAYKSDLIYSVSEMLVNEMLFGGNIAEMFQSAFSNPIPTWFTKGVSAYIAYGWDRQSDDIARDYVLSKESTKFNNLNEDLSIVVGQSIWNFIAQKYGQRSVSNILNLARIIRNEESSIGKTLGITYPQFVQEWRKYYADFNNIILENYQVAPSSSVISSDKAKVKKISDLKFNREGTLLAYASLDNGKYDVRVINMNSRDELLLFKGGEKLLHQEFNENYPLLSWVDEFTLAILSVIDGRNVITIKRVGARGEQVLPIPNLSQIQSFEFKEGGKLAVMTAVINGVSDVYLYLVNRGSIRRVTNDRYDDRDASFLPSSNIIVFSSNRSSDSVYVEGPNTIKEVNVNQFNLYTYDLDLVDSVFGKLTNSLAIDATPYALDSENLFYLSDQQGINNLYKFQMKDSLSSQMSSYALSLKDYSLDPINNRLAFITTQDSEDVIVLQGIEDLQQAFTPVTPRRAFETSKILAELRRKRLIESNVKDTVRANAIGEIAKPVQPKIDSLKEGAIDTDNYVFKNESKVDSKNYKFEKPTENTQPAVGRSFLSIYQNRQAENKIRGPLNYENRFQTDNVITTFVIDEIRSFSQLLEIQMADYLENHRFHGGVLVPYNFKSGMDIFLEYEYLKERFDVRAKYYRKSIRREDRNTLMSQRYNLNRFEVGLALPQSSEWRFELSPFVSQTKFIDQNPLLLLNAPANIIPERTASYVGFKASIVYDDSFVAGVNVHEGTRAKITYESHYKANADAVGFNNLEVDLRHYEKLTKGVYLAGRFFYGRYGGSAPKQYLLGGVDNWAFNKTISTGDEKDPLLFQTLFDNSDILFHQFTNLRGYDYNSFQGKNVLTLSAELRFPISQLLEGSDTQSAFVRNLQIIGFYDLGSAWQDLSPFKERNNLNTVEIQEDGSPFSAVINNFSNPWLQSVGGGMRTMFFGFYSRMDVAWPIRDFTVQTPRFQLSIGYDF
ncbi:MAG: hypothetical protein COW03_16230 [Cytophagales bacterium CG12_big_fil_rev_8_21_14_0_65_40_12]|nr:MAG: hypothetical protein COW03_16230 [Cytophagales bacterium CG12_big_fil_rev_8_21_14_0_65_40_12]PIW05303.1 MAG: hypothetical protein COW40_05185 [Cytophagales bacterium CG17_big_fil_post_rev_8_21_14_2_50_40_13]